MAEFYNITAYEEGDQYQSKFGMLQTYWLEIEGYTGTIKTDKKPGNPPRLGQNYGSLEVKTNAKGGTYYKFRGEKMPEGTTVPVGGAPVRQQTNTATPNSSTGMPGWFIPVAKQIEYIYTEMKKVDDTPSEVEVTNEDSQEDESQEENVISPEDQAIMDDIFGGPVEKDEK